MSADPLVLQMVIPKFEGHPRPFSSGQVCPLSQAKAVIAANHTAAGVLGYTSAIDGDGNWVKYSTSAVGKAVEIKQGWIPAGKWFRAPAHPLTGINPGFAPVANPSIGLGTDIWAIFGQSNADLSGSGRHTASGLTYAYAENGLFYSCSDPMGGGSVLGGTDAGPWARLADRAMGRTALNGQVINRIVVASRAHGGTDISYWAAADTFPGTSTTSLAIGTGSKVFTTQAGLLFTVGMILRATSTSTGRYMDGLITAYSGSSLTMNVFGTSGTGTLSDWVLNPPGAGDGYAYARAQLLNMLNAGLTPTRVVFAQGEANVLTPASWTEAVKLSTYWITGFNSFVAGVRGSPLGIVAPIYVAETTLCNQRDILTVGAPLDDVIERAPDWYVTKELAREAIRIAQRAQVTGVSIRSGPDIDQINPTLREDGCHLGSHGLHDLARRWCISFFGSE